MNAPVVIRFGAFGDMVLLLPLLRQLARFHGQPVDVVSSGGWTRPLLEPQSCVGSLRLLTSRRAPYWFNASQRELVVWLRARADAPVYLCETDAKSKWLVERAGVTAHWAGAHPVREDEHWLQRWRRLGALWTGQADDPEALPAQLREGWVEVPPAARQDLAAWLQRRGWDGAPLILLQPGSKRTMRRGAVDRSSNDKFWPVEHWAAVARHVLDRQPQARVLICGSPEEIEFTRAIEAAVEDARLVSVADDLPIPRLLALLSQAAAMISVDTGPAHAAAALGCPLVVLFGEMNPVRWRPWGLDGEVRLVRADGRPIREIALPDVVAAWDGLRQREA